MTLGRGLGLFELLFVVEEVGRGHLNSSEIWDTIIEDLGKEIIGSSNTSSISLSVNTPMPPPPPSGLDGKATVE